MNMFLKGSHKIKELTFKNLKKKTQIRLSLYPSPFSQELYQHLQCIHW